MKHVSFRENWKEIEENPIIEKQITFSNIVYYVLQILFCLNLVVLYGL